MRFISIAAFVLVGACACATATSEAVRFAPMPAVAQAEANEMLEGTIEVLIEDSDQGSRMLYFLLISSDQRVPLRFASPPPNLTTGTRVRVRGRRAEDGALVVTSFERI